MPIIFQMPEMIARENLFSIHNRSQEYVVALLIGITHQFVMASKIVLHQPKYNLLITVVA
jgi:FMN-dependent NADH-azoreductase